MYDYIVVGTGYAGAISARIIAETLDKKVLLLDKRNHIAGNMYDEYDKNQILVHKYGPHISVMKEKKAFDFLSRFTEWQSYHHTVKAVIDDIEVPLPINFTSIDMLFTVEESIELKQLLIDLYSKDANVPILDLLKSGNDKIRTFAEFIYEKVFVHYTMKMWGVSPNEIDPSVTARIPVRLSYDNKHFLHKYQVMPKNGFTKLFENMLDHPNITIKLGINAVDVLKLDPTSKLILFNNEVFDGKLVYTGSLDELFGYKYGVLPYRSLRFEFNTENKGYVQDCTTLNWPDDRPATRRTDMKRLTSQKIVDLTTTVTEYPGAYNLQSKDFNEPYYPIINEECIHQYNKYYKLVEAFQNVYTVGRLADYKYYNMEATVLRALEVAEKIVKQES